MSSEPVIQKLTEIFMKFPGIGPRQAKRFVYHLLKASPTDANQLTELITELKKNTVQCLGCGRFFSPRSEVSRHECEICHDSSRDQSLLMLIEKDIDLDNIQRSGTYTGRYFVLGGLVPILAKVPEQTIHSKSLLKQVGMRSEKGLQEVILALSANEEGDNTVEFLKKYLAPLSTKYNFKLSVLGRGLSTGTELEYSDAETLKNALRNRE